MLTVYSFLVKEGSTKTAIFHTFTCTIRPEEDSCFLHGHILIKLCKHQQELHSSSIRYCLHKKQMENNQIFFALCVQMFLNVMTTFLNEN